jgi:hypothetical protein
MAGVSPSAKTFAPKQGQYAMAEVAIEWWAVIAMREAIYGIINNAMQRHAGKLSREDGKTRHEALLGQIAEATAVQRERFERHSQRLDCEQEQGRRADRPGPMTGTS